jgi:hypothetical protein
MKILMCTQCYELYNANYIAKEYCPKSLCHNKLVEIDENIAIPIQTLNKKGYETLYCCSGHFKLETAFQPYIMFKAWGVPPSLPVGWSYLNDMKQPNSITFLLTEKLSYWQAIENLYKWAEELPPNKSNSEEVIKK